MVHCIITYSVEDFYLFIICYEVGLSVGDYQPIYDNEEVCKYVSKYVGKDVDYDILFKS